MKVFKFVLEPDDIKPSPPIILCTTHKENKISTNNSPVFLLSSIDNTGIKGFSYFITTQSNYVLKEEVRTSRTNIKIKKLKDGNWYFYAKSVDYNNNWSDTSIFSLKIDSTAPIIQNISHKLIPKYIYSTNYSKITNIIETNRRQKTNVFSKSRVEITTNLSISFFWDIKEQEDKVGYSYSFSPKKILEPEKKVLSALNNVSFDKISKQKYYFKIKVRDQYGNWSHSYLYIVDLRKKKKVLVKSQITGSPMFIYDDVLHYKVKRGDRMANIISQLLLTANPSQYIKPLSAYNYIDDINLIYPGEILKIPLLRIPETINPKKIRPGFLSHIKDKIIRIKWEKDGITVQKVHNLNTLKKNNLILIRLPLFLRTGKFYFY